TAGSNGDHAAVDVKVDAGDIACVVRRQEQRRLGDFFGLADPAKWYLCGDIRAKLFELSRGQAHLSEDWRLDGAGADGVDPNFAVLQFRRPASGEGTHGGFRRRVNAEAGHSLRVRYGRIEDDRSAVDDQRQRLLDSEKQAFHIYVEVVVEMRLGDGVERGDFGYSGIGE